MANLEGVPTRPPKEAARFLQQTMSAGDANRLIARLSIAALCSGDVDEVMHWALVLAIHAGRPFSERTKREMTGAMSDIPTVERRFGEAIKLPVA